MSIIVTARRSVFDLTELVQGLPTAERQRFERIFGVEAGWGEVRPPKEMRGWIEEQFGSVAVVLRQRIVRVTNLITLEGAIFNELRGRRPMEGRDRPSLAEELAKGSSNDPLSNPYQGTPEDVFGRVRGRYCLSASNVAKFDGFHGVLVFDEPNPLQFGREQVLDYIDTGLRWAQEARKVDPEAKYYLFIWNCLGRAGASLSHGHAQMTLGKGMHYAKVESLRRAAIRYKEQYRSDYFEDLFGVHRALGCGFVRGGVQAFASLTPVKEKETVLTAPTLSHELKERIYEALTIFRDGLGVVSFNLAIYMPPLAETEESWEGFPVQVRLVDRGDPRARASDWGSMEMYAQSVVASDPFEVARVLKDGATPT